MLDFLGTDVMLQVDVFVKVLTGKSAEAPKVPVCNSAKLIEVDDKIFYNA